MLRASRRDDRGADGHLGAWLHRVATNRAIDYIRKAKRRQERETRFAVAQEASTQTEWDDVYEYVDEAIAELPERLRDPVVAHYLEGQTHANIARVLGLSRQAITRRIAKGVNAIRVSLKRRGITVAPPALAAMLVANLAEAASIPASLESTLGKLAVAGLKSSVTTTAVGTAAATVGGFLVMKKLAIGLAIIIVALVGTWTLTNDEGNGKPSNSTPTIEAKTQDNAVASSREPEPIESPAGVGADLDLPGEDNTPVEKEEPLSEGGTITGRIYDADSGDGLVGLYAYVHPADERSEVGDYEKSDKLGYYRVSGLPPGTYTVSPQRPVGYPRTKLMQRLTVSLADDQTLEGIDLAIKKGISVSGQVLSADGRPVEGARVGAMVLGMPGPGVEHANSQQDGSFVVSLGEAGSDLVVQARNDDFESEPVGPFVLTVEGLEGLVLRLTEPKSGSVSGTVSDSSGRPIEGATIHVDRGRTAFLIGLGSDKSAADGTFSIEGLAEGEYSVIPSPPGVRTWSKDDEVIASGTQPRTVPDGVAHRARWR